MHGGGCRAGFHRRARSHRADFMACGAPAVLHLLVEAAQSVVVNGRELFLAVVHLIDLRLGKLVYELVDGDEAAANLDEEGLLPVFALGAPLEEDAPLAELVDAFRDSDEHDPQAVAITLLRQVLGERLVDLIVLAADVDLVPGVVCLFLGHLALERVELRARLGLLELGRQLPLNRS